jgi:hypothetical protein
MKNEINDRTLIADLRTAFPELEQPYQELADEWAPEIPNNYTVVGALFAPYFRKEVEKGEITDLVHRLVDFIERVSSSGDLEAINVIWVKIFEPLIFNEKQLQLLWPMLGPATKEHIKDAAKRWSIAIRWLNPEKQGPEESIPQ